MRLVLQKNSFAKTQLYFQNRALVILDRALGRGGGVKAVLPDDLTGKFGQLFVDLIPSVHGEDGRALELVAVFLDTTEGVMIVGFEIGKSFRE